MKRIRSLALGTVGGFALMTGAHAADPSWHRPYAPEPFVELVSGWYLRGDLGYRFNHIGSIEAANAVTSHRYPDTLSVTFGGGYKFNWFRTDLTVDYGTPAVMEGHTAAAVGQPQYTAKLDATTLLANAYFDLGTWAGFTPYIGGGLGATYLRSPTHSDTATPGVTGHNSRTNFSWALMAGVAYRLHANWLIDASFRHLDMGDFVTPTVTWKALTAQEARLGIRMLID